MDKTDAKFVQKGLGWFLREAWKIYPERIDDYLMKNKTIFISLIFFTAIISVSAQRMCEKKKTRIIDEIEAVF